MKLKFGFILLAAATMVLLPSCKQKKLHDVKKFAETFAENASANKISMLKESYPGISNADSLHLEYMPNGIMVSEMETPDTYEIMFSPNVRAVAVLGDGGQVYITESRGLFAYPDEKVSLAKRTGLWDDSLNDVDLAKRMHDEGFFNYLAERNKAKTSNILSVGKYKESSYDLEGYYPIINNTDQEISGNDYVVNVKETTYDYYYDSWSPKKTVTNTTRPGQRIDPHGSVNIKVYYGDGYDETVTGVTLNMSQEEIRNRFASYTGHEYQEYKNSK